MRALCVHTVRVFYPLTDARAITLSPQHTLAMATQKDFDYSQVFLNACVLLDGLCPIIVLILTHYSSPGPSASQNTGQACVNFFVVVLLLKDHPYTVLKSPNPTEIYLTNTLW